MEGHIQTYSWRLLHNPFKWCPPIIFSDQNNVTLIVFPTANFMKVWIKCVREKLLSKSLEGTFCHFVWISAARKLSPQHWFFNFNSKVAPWVAVFRIILQYDISTFTQNLIVKWLEKEVRIWYFPNFKSFLLTGQIKVEIFFSKTAFRKIEMCCQFAFSCPSNLSSK